MLVETEAVSSAIVLDKRSSRRCCCMWKRMPVNAAKAATFSSLLVGSTLAVVVSLRATPESEQPGPSNLLLLVDKKDIGSIQILSTLDWLEGSQHQKSRIQQVGFDLLRNRSGLHTFHCQ